MKNSKLSTIINAFESSPSSGYDKASIASQVGFALPFSTIVKSVGSSIISIPTSP